MRIAGDEHEVRIKPYKGGTLAVLDGGELIDIVGRWVPGQRLLSVTVDGRQRIVQVRRAGRDWELQTRGAQPQGAGAAAARRRAVEAHDREGAARPVAAAAGADAGAADRLDVAVGDKVEPGQPVAVMEAMKMENILRAPKAATVKATPAKAGDSLAVDQVIVEFE